MIPNADRERRRDEFDAIVREVRPQLLRYCARISGSVVDGEDVVQDTLVKAYGSLSAETPVARLRPWLFRIAHNQAIDHLRRMGRLRAEPLEEELAPSEPDSPLEAREMAAIALSFFLRLTPLQRSCVFLKDVMGCTLDEIGQVHGASLQAVKAALHRGRGRLREWAGTLEQGAPAALDPAEQGRLVEYVQRFNARDFDSVRAMLAADVQLDLVGRVKKRGAEVSEYFTNYGKVDDWRLAVGTVERRPAILVLDPRAPSSRPLYFILIEWRGGRIERIRDYRYARHVAGEAEITLA